MFLRQTTDFEALIGIGCFTCRRAGKARSSPLRLPLLPPMPPHPRLRGVGRSSAVWRWSHGRISQWPTRRRLKACWRATIQSCSWWILLRREWAACTPHWVPHAWAAAAVMLMLSRAPWPQPCLSWSSRLPCWRMPCFGYTLHHVMNMSSQASWHLY